MSDTGTIRRTTIQQHFRGKLFCDNQISMNKPINANSLMAGSVTVNSGQTVATVSLTTVKSDSTVFLQKATVVASNMIVEFAPNSIVDSVSFAVAASAAVTAGTTVNYLIFEVQ